MHHRRWLGDRASILTVCSCVLLSMSSVRAGSAVTWKDTDIGSPKSAGSSSEYSGSWTIKGGGTGIGGTADQLHFLYAAASGDIDLRVRIGSLRGAGTMQAGLTIRESTVAGAPQASLIYSPLTGLSFVVRTASGQQAAPVATLGSSERVFVRLVRKAGIVSALYSADGSSWTLIKRVSLALPADVVAGVAVSNDGTSTLGIATFAKLSLSTTPWANQPPVVSITAPADKSAFDLPATLTFAASATDPDGVVRRVDFLLDGVSVGSSTSAPYRLPWTAPGPGAHTLQVVATDDDGSRAASAAVGFTIRDSVSLPTESATRAQFYPSRDHDTLVDFYKLEIRRASDGLSKSPLEAMNLGKPVVEGGIITVDVTAMFNALPSGEYYAVVKAVGDGGAGTSEKLPFTW